MHIELNTLHTLKIIQPKLFLVVFGLVIITFVISIGLFKSYHKVNKNVRLSPNASNEVGEFQLAWTNSKINNAGSIDENDTSHFIMNAAQNKVYNASSNTGGGGHATYQLVFNMGGSKNAPAGSITIKIPRYLYYGRDGKPLTNQVIDIPLVEYPNEGGTGFNWRYEKDDDGNDWIVLENNQEISASYLFECSITWILVTPSELADGYTKNIQGTVSVDFEQDDLIDILANSNTLKFENKSHAAINSHYNYTSTHWDNKSASYINVYSDWNNNWSDSIKPENASDYVYAIWNSYTQVNYATQPYSLKFRDEVVDDLGGEIIGYCRNSSSSSTDSCFSKNVTDTSTTYSYGYDPSNVYGNSSHKASTQPLTASITRPFEEYEQYYYYYYMVKYPKDLLQDGETHTLKNKSIVELTGVDGATDVKESTSEVNYKYVYIEPTEAWVDIPGVVPIRAGTLYDDIAQATNWSTSALSGRCSRDSCRYHDTYGLMRGGLNTLSNSDSNYKTRLGGKSSSYRNWANYGYFQGYNLTYSGAGSAADLDNYGVKKYKVNLVNEDFLASNADTDYVKLGYGDYELTSFYIENFYQYDYTYQHWDSTNSSTMVTTHYSGYKEAFNSDYSSYPEIDIFYKTNGNWKKLGTIKTTSSNTYKFIDNEGNEKTINSSNMVDLPAGTTGIKASFDTNRYSSYLYLNFKSKIINSDKVQSIYKDSDTLRVYNVNTMYAEQDGNIYTDDSYGYGLRSNFSQIIHDLDQERYGLDDVAHEYDYMDYSRISGGTTYQSKSVTYNNDVLNRRVVANYTAYAYEYRNFDSDVLTAKDIYDYKIINEQKVGTFYDLLPLGVSADLSTVKVTGYKNGISIPSTASVKPNWQGTGRDMLIVKAKVDENKTNRQNYSGETYSGMQLTFKAYYSWDSIADYGSYLVNTVAYKSGSGKLSNGYPDDSSSISTSTIADKDYMSDLDEDGNPEGTIKDTVYAQTGLSFAFNTASDASFRKEVKTANMTDFVDGQQGDVVANAGGYYTYQLRYQSQKNMKSTGLVIYDQLETYDDGTPSWKGKLIDINLVQPKSKGIEPVVYYTTKTDLNFYEKGKAIADEDPPSVTDISDTSIWSTEPPEDMSSVTAIAIDLSKDKNGNDYTLKSEESVTITMTMQAPVDNAKELEAAGATAKNASWWKGTTQQGNEAPHFSYSVYEWTQVLLHDVPISLDKQSFKPTGTEADPAMVQKGEKIIYDVVVKNDSTFESFSDVLVTDEVSDSVLVHPDYLAYYKTGEGSINEYRLLSEDGAIDVEFDNDNRKMNFNVKQLLAGEELHILIPVTVTTSNKELITNQAQLRGFNNVKYELWSPKTYHVSSSGNVSITKKVDALYDLRAIDKHKEFKFKVTLALPIEDENVVDEDIPADDIEQQSNSDTENTNTIEHYRLVDEIEDLDLLNTKYGDVEFVDGVGVFSLKDGETINLYNLPVGMKYTIEEEDYSKDGYETKISNKTGLIEGDSHIDVVVTNTYTRPFKNPVTGNGVKTLFVIVLLSIVILGISVRNKKIIRKFRK